MICFFWNAVSFAQFQTQFWLMQHKHHLMSAPHHLQLLWCLPLLAGTSCSGLRLASCHMCSSEKTFIHFSKGIKNLT